MNRIKQTITHVGVLLYVCWFSACTSNPVGENEIGAGNREISGRVQLDLNNQPESVYVWLEGFDFGAFTNADGEFSLTLPAGSIRGATGVFRLYFYVANYKLDFEEVAIRNGSFIYDEAALNADGELRSAKRLHKFLTIRPQVEPTAVQTSFNGNIRVSVELQTRADIADTATVVFPKTTAGFLGPIFFRNVESGQVFVFEPLRVETEEKILVGASPVVRSTALEFTSLNLSAGRYEITPFLKVMHQEIPQGLLESLGVNPDELTPNYLKMPFVREGGEFEVMADSES